MSTDLDTLLRDAGREPTIDLDVDQVHARGRRRAMTRRVAVGTGALVLVGALAISVSQLLGEDRPGLDPIDAAPPTEVPADDLDATVSSGTTPRAELAAELDHDIGLHGREADGDVWTVERTRTDGSAATRSLVLPAMVGNPVVDAAGAVWSTDDGQLLRDGEPLMAPDPEFGDGAWLPVGTDEVGNVVVGAALLRGGPGPEVLHSVGPAGEIAPSALDQVAAPLPPGAGVLTFDEGREHAVVLAFVTPREPDETHLLVLLVPYGGEPRELLSEPTVVDAVGSGTVAAVQIVGDEVWLAVIAPDGDTSRIVRVPLDPAGEVTALPTPDPEGRNRLAGQVQAIAATDDGEVVLLGRRDGDEFLAPYVVRPAMADALAEGAITELDARGLPTLLPASGDAASLAACADDEDAPINASPSGFGGQVWWLCWDAAGQLPDGVAHPFVATELFSGGDGSMPEDGPLAVLRAWADGPAAFGIDAGLTGGLDAEVATITAAVVDGRNVTVDLAAGPEVGVLGTTTGGATAVQGIVGTALQYGTLDTVTITLDGSCSAWAALLGSESEDPLSCTYDRTHAPWNQGVAACARDQEALNAAPPPGEVVVWRWCPDAIATRPADAHGEAFVAVPSPVAVSDPPTADELHELVAATLAPTDDEDAARGLEPAAGVRRLPDADDLAVAVDGGTVTIDWSEDYVEVLPLSTPFPAGLLETALAGAVLQFDAFDRVVFAIEGSCEAYGATGEAMLVTCIRIDRGDVLWADGASRGPAGPEDVRDGRIPALLSGVEPELGALAVDVVQYLTGAEADAAYTADTGESGGAPNDYWIRNQDVFPEGVAVLPDADVQLVRLREDGDPDLDRGTIGELPDYLDEYGGEILVWLTVVDGEVTAIEEQYAP